jgi:Putative DNA-binding domain
VPPLAEIQFRVRNAVVAGESDGVESLLVGRELGRKRLEIHRRQYEASLVNALVEKFPGCGWLAGSAFVAEAARRYIRQHPPEAPCIAEYGAGFPQFVGHGPRVAAVPYLGDFAELEWRVGQVAIAVQEPTLSLAKLSAISPDSLPDVVLVLQPGIRYFEAGWPVDELLKFYLAETAPELLVFDPAPVWLEIQGARGEFNVTRLDFAEFLFRQSLWEGQSIGDAADRALNADAVFDPGKALAGVISGGLITAIR